MKKLLFKFLYLSLFLLLLAGCGQSQSQTNDGTPDAAVDKFLQALQKQNYADAKSYYAENLDNMAHFRNQIEEISPTIANKLFSKMADFSYTIEKTTIDPNNASKATVSTTINAYDLGKSFESTVLEYIKTDIEMTFDGAKSDEIIKEAESIILQDIENSQQTFSTNVEINLTKQDGNWKLDKISDNQPLLNALSGNIIDTINIVSSKLNPEG